LSALDDETRREMYELLEHVQQSTSVTILHVTHNLDEAEQLADRIYLLRNGRVECRE
jgi:ABC-type nitrate/sulfonate/bicarbonate transport system ATPase subunit